jgi:hypothetical protein
MMGKIGIKGVETVVPPPALPRSVELNEEDRSKDDFFVQLGEIAEAMIARHGKDFAMGTLLLSAKFIAEGKPLSNRTDGGHDSKRDAKPA